MPDILIYRMEMPENEPLRLVLNQNGQLFVDHGVTFTEYEAVELPEHGDLIEAEPIKKFITDGLNNKEFGYDTIQVLTEIEYAPVIIPSNKEETK